MIQYLEPEFLYPVYAWVEIDLALTMADVNVNVDCRKLKNLNNY